MIFFFPERLCLANCCDFFNHILSCLMLLLRLYPFLKNNHENLKPPLHEVDCKKVLIRGIIPKMESHSNQLLLYPDMSVYLSALSKESNCFSVLREMNASMSLFI